MSAEDYRRMNKPKRGKYGTRLRTKDKPTCDGLTFDSGAEMTRYRLLKDRQKRGEISDIETQVRYPLYAVDGEEVCTFILDFRWKENGHTVVEDYKSDATDTDIFNLKCKLFYHCYGFPVQIYNPETKKAIRRYKHKVPAPEMLRMVARKRA